jgi:hypothetical protein
MGNRIRIGVALAVLVMYDHCAVKFLSQAGVKVTAMALADHGVYGNGHMVMIEKTI